MTATPGQADPWQVIADVMSELLRGGQTAGIRCRAALGVLASAGIDFDGDPVAIAAQEPHAADGALERALRALKALDELFKIDSDLRNPWNTRALTIVLRGLGRGGTADEEINAALGPDPQPAPRIPLRSDAETADMLRADLADAEDQLARWPKCPAGCNCRIGIDDDPDRNECGCDGPCNGGEQPAPEADVALASIAADRNQLRMALNRIAMATAGDPSVAADKALAASSENARRTPALGALEPQPAPELTEQVKQLAVTLRGISDQQEASGHPEGAYATGCAATMVEALIPPPGCGCTVCEAVGSQHGVPQPAPEFPAAMAALALARVLSWFEQFGTRRTVSATRAQLAHAYQDGGLTVPEELRRFL